MRTVNICLFGLIALAGGAALGGVLRAAGAAALTMPLTDGGGWGPPPSVIAAAVAYPLGAGVGAHWLGRTQSASVPILTSLAGTAVGAGVWGGIGNAFDPEGQGDSASGTDYTAWIIGSALGFAIHVVVTAVLVDRCSGSRAPISSALT